MKIAIISPFIYRYRRGVESYTLNLAKALAQSGHSITIIAWNENHGLKIDLSNNMKVLRVPHIRYYRKYAAALFYLFYFLLNKTDVINIFFTWQGEGLALHILNLVKRQRFNIILPNPLSQIPHRIGQYKMYNLHKRAGAVIAPSSFAKKEAEIFFGREAGVRPRMAAARFFKPGGNGKLESRKQLNIEEGACACLTVSAFERRKGIKEFIEAIDLLKDKGRISYLIIGEVIDRAYYNEVEGLIRGLGIAGAVRIFEPTADILPFYQAADCFVMLSSGEGCPNAFLEAVSCGLPVFVSDEPPFDEYRDEGFGLFVNKQDPKAIAEKLNFLINNRESLLEMGEKARRYALDNFNLQGV